MTKHPPQFAEADHNTESDVALPTLDWRNSQGMRRRRPLARAAACTLEAMEKRMLLAATGFQPRVDYPVTGSANFVTLADLNGDSIPDMVVSSYAGSLLSVRLGQGNGTFLTGNNIPLTAAPDYVAAADLNGDGKMDLIAAHFDADTITVLLGNGNGTFGAATTFAAGTGPRAFTIGDFNGDGKLDLLMAKTFDKRLTLLLGNGNGTFQSPVHYSVSFTPTVVVAGDFNNDGKLDLAASDFYTDKVHVSLGNGNGTFQSAVAIGVGAGPSDLVVGDFNGDGKLDIATANFLGNNVSILRGNGNGTFLAAVNVAAGSGATSLAAVDLNQDGKLDLAVANANADTITVLIGNGSGGFSFDANYATGSSPRSIKSARLNGDVFPDLVVTHEGANTVGVLLAVPSSSNMPVANAGGPYSVNEGGTVALNGAASSGSGLTYHWDLDGDGIFGETGASATRGNETGATPTFVATGLDGPSTYTVWLRVTNSSGSHTTTATINVVNIPPTLGITGSAQATAGSPYTLLMSSSDPGDDTIIRWTINWGDGVIETINGNPSSATHTYSTVGASYTISATATDEDGTWPSNSFTITVASSTTDTIHPTAVLWSAPNVSSADGAVYRFVVKYDDNVGINLSFLDNNDILVTGPNGYSQLARFISVTSGGGNAQLATYEISAPGGAWSMAANGAYTFAMQKGQVRDTTGNSVRHGTLGSFQCAIAPPDLAGNDLATALDIGTMSAGRIKAIDEWVGTLDRNDFYKFTISAPVNLDVRLFNLTQNADLMLLDSAGNRILYLKRTGTAAETFTRAMTPGTYYLRVLFAGTSGTTYRLRLEAQAATGSGTTAAPSDDNSMETARDIGTIGRGTIRAYDEYIGPDDRNDFYKITITQPLRIYVKLTGMTNNADLMLLDSAGNRIAYSKRGGSSDEFFQLDLSPGTYFIRVLFAGTVGTDYRLRIEGM